MRAGKTTDETEEAWTKRRDAGAVATPPLALALRFLKTPSTVETEGGIMEIRPDCDGHYKLRDQIAMLGTPTGMDARGPTKRSKKFIRKTPTPVEAMAMLPTPRAEDAECCGAHRGSPDSIYSKIKMLPTPNRTAWKSGQPMGKRGAHTVGIQDLVSMLPTPQGADAERRGGDFARSSRPGSGGDDLTTAIRRTPEGKPGKSRGMRLQPAFVEWMMGYPDGWTDVAGRPGSKPSGTRSSRKSHTKS
jgi:DNA (cytosine-5)-methyltransferase 1